jgi:hypothetical protein
VARQLRFKRRATQVSATVPIPASVTAPAQPPTVQMRAQSVNNRAIPAGGRGGVGKPVPLGDRAVSDVRRSRHTCIGGGGISFAATLEATPVPRSFDANTRLLKAQPRTVTMSASPTRDGHSGRGGLPRTSDHGPRAVEAAVSETRGLP